MKILSHFIAAVLEAGCKQFLGVLDMSLKLWFLNAARRFFEGEPTPRARLLLTPSIHFSPHSKHEKAYLNFYRFRRQALQVNEGASGIRSDVSDDAGFFLCLTGCHLVVFQAF